jgi:prepilin-type N-terminal cleavage/methylation domain-containing protein
MRRISPVPICRPRAGGFSLVELIVAVAILALLVGAVARALMTSMKGEEASELMFEGRLGIGRIETAVTGGADAEALAQLAPKGWRFREEILETGPKTNLVVWRKLELRSEQRSATAVTLWLEAGR